MDRISLGTRKVSIEFPGVKALNQVDFEVSTGEIRAVVGANGAGKSTLMKVLAGANPEYTGEVCRNGKAVELRTPLSAKRLGIQIVYQEVDTALVPTFSVAENVMLNETVLNTRGRPMMNWRKLYRQAGEVLDRLHIKVNVRKLVQDLTLAEKQMVLIARAIQSECSFLILDEPTAPLSDTETKELFSLVKHLRETENIAIIFISHRINEIIQICDNYTVMRNGEIVDTSPVNEKTTTKEIVEKMLGRSFEENFPKEKTSIGEKMFEVDHLSGADGKVDDVSLYVRSGEIVGVAGLVGAGKSELCKTIFGGYRRSGGSIRLNGRELNIKIPTHAVKNRIALVPEERRKEGVLVTENVNFNLSAANLSKYCRASFILKSKVSANAKRFVQELGITTPSIWQIVKNLSGGNQQKVSVGKWLAADCSVYIFDEPTKGVDVGAKREIFHLINDIAKRGNAVIYATCINGTIGGPDAGIEAVLAFLRAQPEFRDLEHKDSRATKKPFQRMKVKLKKEIVTMGVETIDPTRIVGTYVEPADWNALITDPDTIVIDTRNDYETAIGTFRGAVDPDIKTFREFPGWVRANESLRGKPKIAMFCTGGIRCEKATAFMKEEGFEEVYHLKGGILKYLEQVPAGESLWDGACFVFDERVSVVHDLREGDHKLCRACRNPLTADAMVSPLYEAGVSCPACHEVRSEDDRSRFREREKQARLARERGQRHIGS